MLVSGYWIKTKIQISNKMPGSGIQYPDEFILRYEGRSLIGLRRSFTNTQIYIIEGICQEKHWLAL